METIPTLAQTLAQYGPWGFIAVLTVAVVYLFKLVLALQKEMRDNIQQNLRDTLEVVASAKRVMERKLKSE